MKDEEVIKDYFSTLSAEPANTIKVFAIGFIGLPGTGKTTVARELSDKLGLPMVSNDDLRRYLNKLGFEGHTPRQDLVRVISEARTAWFYRHQTSVIVDADFSERRLVSEQTAAANDATLLLVKTVCDEAKAIDRIQRRLASTHLSESSRGDVESYARGKLRHANYPVDSVFATINTGIDIGSQIENIVEQLREQQFIVGRQNGPNFVDSQHTKADPGNH